MKKFSILASVLLSVGLARSTNILLTSDDGWAVAMIRAQNTALLDAHYNVILSSPADNKSGTGSSSAPPTVLNKTCQFDTCPIGSPPQGFNASDPRLNYVNSFPVDAVSHGIRTLAPKFFGQAPDFVVSGPNVGTNLGTHIVGISGTVGAACQASLLGVPSAVFSGGGLSQVSYTDLANNNTNTFSAKVFADLTVEFVDAFLADGKPYLPPGVTINVNYPALSSSSCASPSDFTFILTRISPDPSVTDVKICGTDHLPGETEVVGTRGCFASVSVMNATTKADVDATTQAFVSNRLTSFLSCLPEGADSAEAEKYQSPLGLFDKYV